MFLVSPRFPVRLLHFARLESIRNETFVRLREIVGVDCDINSARMSETTHRADWREVRMGGCRSGATAAAAAAAVARRRFRCVSESSINICLRVRTRHKHVFDTYCFSFHCAAHMDNIICI